MATKKKSSGKPDVLPPKKKAKSKTRSRSAKTGKYVTKKFAGKHPNTTVDEKID